MKKKIVLILILVLILVLISTFYIIGCASQANYVEIPKGYSSKEEHYQKGGFQDYADYAKYIYPSKEIIENDDQYEKVTKENILNITGYFEDFYNWMETSDRIDKYDFDKSIINVGDYIRIKTKEGKKIGDSNYGKYDNYSVYYFDVETLTLYYIHNNI